jgi:hypothetical protein
MSILMSKGFLIFAENAKSCNYVEQAYALALSIKNTQSTVSTVSLVTNDTVPKNQQHVFDHIISIPWISKTIESTYKAEHRWKLFHVTPYDETIVLDADMIFLDDVSDWWDYCSNHDLRFCSKIKNYKRELVVKDVVHRRAFIDNNLTNPYFALHYFKKSDKALEFYKALEFISNNWEWCYTKFAPVSYQNWLSMDLASAVAIEMTGFYDAVIDQTCPLEFVHMKPGIQSWTAPGNDWQDAVPYVLNSRGELIVGNIRQSKLFHYVEKNFMSKKILSILKEIHNG